MIDWNERTFTPYYILSNVRRLLAGHREWRSTTNWFIASEVYAVGCNSARQICIDAGIEPDAFAIDGKAFTPTVKLGKALLPKQEVVADILKREREQTTHLRPQRKERHD